MHVQFLLGPAGSGKTFRCVEEVRAELRRSPDGPPLVFLAPKQATFQIERQLLSTSELTGYSRLQILSFERLAAFVLDQFERPFPELLSEAGRVMVLRALLARHHAELKIFRASARLAGFATQLSQLLREFQCHRVAPAKLTALAAAMRGPGRLADKLGDLALLLGHYEAWLQQAQTNGRKLEDASRLLDLAADALRTGLEAGRRLPLAGLWLDGFAEMTPQEIALLAALVPHAERATLAFCLESEPAAEVSWLSPWTVVGRTFSRCREAVAQTLGTSPAVSVLARDAARSRFAHAPQLAALERVWAAGHERAVGAPAADTATPPSIRLVACPDAEAEATLAAREILQHVQGGGRFRDCAILVRSLEDYHDVLRRVLHRYEIPLFLDRREVVTHHPLAELTRYALRTVAFDWRQEDWFGALKTGLVQVTDEDVDRLENEALKRGWAGRVWQEPFALPDDPGLAPELERLRQRILPPFATFAELLQRAGFNPDGALLAAAIRRLWRDLPVEETLTAWRERAADLDVNSAAHETVWTQLNDWLDNLERAFGPTALPLRDWLPIVEAGLAGLTVGVIPPSLDQVLVGSVDRSRNPDLQRVFVLGLNEGVFPAPPAPGVLLTDPDRLELEAHGVALGAGRKQQLGHERYFGYIAFTRASRALTVTWASLKGAGETLNPSAFVAAIKRAVPGLDETTFTVPDWPGAWHRTELIEPILSRQSARASDESAGQIPPASDGLDALAAGEEFAPVVQRWTNARLAVRAVRLGDDVARRLYGHELATSVSALEDFTACPFHFLAARTLRTQEREEFVVDARERGSFQHEVLQRFHLRVHAAGKRWRDLAPAEARQWVREVGQSVMQEYRGGLLNADDAARFTASLLLNNLEQFIETLVGWAGQYGFDPAAVEVSFGLSDAALPAWHVDLGEGRSLKLRGRVDRVDLCRTETGEAFLVIMDYKSGGKQMDAVKIEHGLELQLLAYLAALTSAPEVAQYFGVTRLRPAGGFYVPLRTRPTPAATRAEAAASAADVRTGFQHRGRFDGGVLQLFDARGEAKGDQFRFSKNRDNSFSKRGNEALASAEFADLVNGAIVKLREIGRAIFRGDAAVSPYRFKQETACDRCAYRSVCRFDPWTMPFRRLAAHPPKLATP